MKFSGKVGFWEGDKETSPDVYRPVIKEYPYVGDVYQNTRKFQSSTETTNEDLLTTNQISILSDLYMRENWPSIKYVFWNGIKWKVTNVQVNYPRITLILGGMYNNEEQAVISDETGDTIP